MASPASNQAHLGGDGDEDVHDRVPSRPWSVSLARSLTAARAMLLTLQAGERDVKPKVRNEKLPHPRCRSAPSESKAGYERRNLHGADGGTEEHDPPLRVNHVSCHGVGYTYDHDPDKQPLAAVSSFPLKEVVDHDAPQGYVHQEPAPSASCQHG